VNIGRGEEKRRTSRRDAGLRKKETGTARPSKKGRNTELRGGLVEGRSLQVSYGGAERSLRDLRRGGKVRGKG